MVKTLITVLVALSSIERAGSNGAAEGRHGSDLSDRGCGADDPSH